jgi:hypothetical protein
MRFDPSGLKRAFDRMEDSAKTRGKTMAVAQGDIFLKIMKEESWKIAPTPQRLDAVAKSLKWRLKRKKGVTPIQELHRRIRSRGAFARQWKIVKIKSSGFRIRIWMVDESNESGKVDSKKNVSDKAEKITGKSYKTKLDKLADQVTSDF